MGSLVIPRDKPLNRVQVQLQPRGNSLHPEPSVEVQFEDRVEHVVGEAKFSLCLMPGHNLGLLRLEMMRLLNPRVSPSRLTSVL